MADRILLEYPTKILLEDGTSAVLLEDGTLLLAQESAATATDGILLEDGSGVILEEGAVTITADIAETQGAQTESIVLAETYKIALAETQASQVDAVVIKETYSTSLAETQGGQTESIVAAETYTSGLMEAQASQTEVITGNVGALAITASLDETQAAQSESISGTMVVQKQTGGGLYSRIWKYKRKVYLIETQARQTDEAIAITYTVQQPDYSVAAQIGETQKQQWQHTDVETFNDTAYREEQKPQRDRVKVKRGYLAVVRGIQKQQVDRAEARVNDDDDEEVLITFMRHIA